MIEAAVKQISQMAPPALPAVDLPKVPDLETVPALAKIAHGDPSKLLDAANVLAEDRTTIENAVSQAQQLIKAAGRDLIGIGISLLTKATPVALGMLVPNPAINAAARAHIQGLIASHLAQAFALKTAFERTVGGGSAAIAHCPARGGKDCQWPQF